MKATLIVAIVFAFAVIHIDAKTKWYQLDDYSFEKYVKEFGKQYNDDEFAKRKELFVTRLEKIRAHNKANKSWKEGVNHLTDRTPEEFKRLLGYKKGLAYQVRHTPHPARREWCETEASKIPLSTLPSGIDWRQKGIISAVKDQGECGSCWSFGSAESIESYWALATGQLTDLSEQNILDCTPNTDDCGGTGGCGGGTPELAFQQIINLGGIATEWTYPYISYFGNNYQCQNGSNPFAQLSSYVTLPSNQYHPVLSALANVGPLAINVDASSWSDYESGVYDGCNQTNPDIDHVVQLVGYGVDKNAGNYWLVRNSWNPSWGENGYIRLARHSTLRCGTDLKPQDGTGCNNGPATVTVCGTCGILYDVSYPVVAN